MVEYQKMMVKYRQHNMPDVQSQLHVRKTEAKIIEVIRAYGKTGIAHLQLAPIIGIHRKNLTPYMKRLMSRGLVKRGEGKQGKYYAITKERRGTHMSANILSKAAAAMILKNDDFPVDSPFFRNIVTDNPLAYATFTFSNKLGAIITYLLIQAMNASNKFTRDTENDEEKDLNVEWWIDDAISALRPFLLPIFKDFVISFLTSPYDDFVNSDEPFDLESDGEQLLRYLYYRPFYSLNEKSISELMSAFSKSYPNMTNELEKIRCQLPKVIAQEISQWEHMANRSKCQEGCKHNYKPTSNNKISHCRKCHKTKYDKSLFLKAL